MSRAVAVLVLFAALPACRTRNCAPNTILVELSRPGAASSADHIVVDVTVGTDAPLHADVAVTPGGSTGTFQIDFAGKYPANQPATITLTALQGNDVVATTTAMPTLGATCEKLSMSFSDAVDGGDDTAAPDLACIPTTTTCPADACGQFIDECGGAIVCAVDCDITALVPRLANTGDTITVEGSLSGVTKAILPGGVTADVTLLGSGRGTFTVPAGMTAGPVTVHTGGADLDAGELRRASFVLGLQPWSAEYNQAGGGRQAPTLLSPRQGHAVFASRARVYVFGGRASTAGVVYNTTERIRINADGTLSSPIAGVNGGGTMNTARTGLQVVGTGSRIYVIGGSDGTNALSSIESTTILTDGSLAPFTNETITLKHPREGFTTTIVGSAVYAIGGTDGAGTYLKTIERAPINTDGTMGTFEDVTGTLLTARSQHAAFATTKSLFVVNGVGSGATALGSIEEAPIMGDGSIGAFGTSATTLPGGVSGEATVAHWGAKVFLRTKTASYFGTVNADGSIDAFSLSSIPLLPAMGAGGSRVVVVRDALYDLGGVGATAALAGIARAGLASGAQLVTFTTAGVPLPAGVAQSATMVFGDNVYLFGGADTNGAPLTTTSIYKATANPDDTLSAFAPAVLSLPAALSEIAVAYAEKTVYFIGGYDGTAPSNKIYQLGVGSDGSLVTPTPNPPPPSATMLVARRAARVVVVGGQLCVIGGVASGGATATVECAPINGNGGLSTFATVSDNSSNVVALQTARSSPAVAVVANQIAVIGGTSTTEQSSVEAAGVGTMPNKPIATTFATSATVNTVTPRAQAAPVIVGNQIVLLGGVSNGGLSAHVVAGDVLLFNTPFAQSSDLMQTRRAATAVVIGNQTYVFGGAVGMGDTTTTSIESAPLH